MHKYHAVRSSMPEMDAGFAPVRLERHREGVSCKTTAAYTYDANGHKRWCIDCGAELGEEASWHPEGEGVPTWWVGLLIAMLAVIVFAVILMCVTWNSDAPFGVQPSSIPTTYGPPPTVVP